MIREFTCPRSSTQIALAELEFVYGFLYARVGNRPDAEDLTQQVAMKALPRLRDGAAASDIRGYLYATARSALAEFWSARLSMREAELIEDVHANGAEAGPSVANVEIARGVLAKLSANHRRVLELRFLQGYSLKEVAREMNSTVGAIKVMQLRALRAAAEADGAV